jgi:hypothetical protein
VNIVGSPDAWADLIDPMVPEILNLIVESWNAMPPISSDEKEDNITIALCRILQQNRTVRNLMFQIHIQYVELEPLAGPEVGRLDIAFVPLIPREDIYFCLESKRLNATSNGRVRSYASEYVVFGMLRFVTGQYSKAVRHGGMIAYVLDGDVARAMQNVEANIRTNCVTLRTNPPGQFVASSVLTANSRAKETHHHRKHETVVFQIHHLFMAAK